MVRAIFFDWFNTLARYEPSREEVLSQAFREFDIQISPQKIAPGLLVADKDFFEANSVLPVRKRSPEEQAKIWARYMQTVLTEAGISVPMAADTLVKILRKAQELSKALHFVLFEDVLPTLKALKERGLTLGLLTNVDQDMRPICQALGLEPYVDFVVTSGEVGVDKPHPQIFLTALKRAGVKAEEAIHVGDQYRLDVIGARGVGITPLLLDRFDLYPEVADCPRLRSLAELERYLSQD